MRVLVGLTPEPDGAGDLVQGDPAGAVIPVMDVDPEGVEEVLVGLTPNPEGIAAATPVPSPPDVHVPEEFPVQGAEGEVQAVQAAREAGLVSDGGAGEVSGAVIEDIPGDDIAESTAGAGPETAGTP